MWPTPQEFNEAIQRPNLCFEDEDLVDAKVSLNPLGLPRSITGAFASVYQLKRKGQVFAVRCFLEKRLGLVERYRIIEESLHHNSFDDFVEFRFIERGIKVSGNWYPILKMRWCDGVPLDQYLNKVIGESQKIEKLQEQFRCLVKKMVTAGVAHGDLQHGNILIDRGNLYLVDYDGMFVPRLSGSESVELGHRNFQHPKRDSSFFSSELDNFSSWLIDNSLSILVIDSTLWNRYDGGDDCLLFRHRDLRDPDASELFAELANHPSSEVRQITTNLRRLLRMKPACVPSILASKEELAASYENEENLFKEHIESNMEFLLEEGFLEDNQDVFIPVKRRGQVKVPSISPISTSVQDALVKFKDRVQVRFFSTLAPDIWAEKSLNSGTVAYDMGNYAEAIRWFKQVAEVFATRSDSYVWSYEANIQLGYCYLKTNQIGTAAHYFREAQRYAATFSSHQLSLRSILLLSATYFESGQLERSYELIVKSLKTAQSFANVVRRERYGAFGNSLTIPRLLLHIGHIYLARDDLDSAVVAFEVAIEFSQGIDNESIAPAVKHLVLRAITGFCIARFERDGDEIYHLFCKNVLSASGLKTLIESQDKDLKTGSHKRAAGFLHGLARHYFNDAVFKEAKIAFASALKFYRKLSDGTDYSVYMADCFLGMGKTPEALGVLTDNYDEGRKFEVDLLSKLKFVYEFHYAVLLSSIIIEDGGLKKRNKCLDYLSSIAPTGDQLGLSLSYLNTSKLNKSKNMAILLADCARDLARINRVKDAQEIYSASFKIFQRAGLVDADADRVIECLLVNDDLDTAAKLLLECSDLEKTVRAIVSATVRGNNFQLDTICEIMIKLLTMQMNLPYEHVSEEELKVSLSLLSWCAEEDDLRVVIMSEKVEIWRKRREVTLAHNLIDQGKFGTAIGIFEKHEGKSGPNVVQSYELWSMRYFTMALENREHSRLALVDGYALGCAIEIISTLKDKGALNLDFAMRVAELISRSNPEGMEQHLSVLVDIFSSLGKEFEAPKNLITLFLPSLLDTNRALRMESFDNFEEESFDMSPVGSSPSGSTEKELLSMSANMAVRTKSAVDEKLWKALHRALFLVDRERYGEAVKALTEFEKMDRQNRFMVDANIALGYCQYLLSNNRLAKSYFARAVAESRVACMRGTDRVENYYRAAVCLTQFSLDLDLSKSKIRTLIDPSAQKKDIYRVGASLVNRTIELESDLALCLGDHLYQEAEEHEGLQHTDYAKNNYEAALTIYGVSNDKRVFELVDCLDAVKQYEFAANKLKEVNINGALSAEEYNNLLTKLARRHVRTRDLPEIIEIYKTENIRLDRSVTQVERDLIIEKLTRVLASAIPPERYLSFLIKDLEKLIQTNDLDLEFAQRIAHFVENNIDSCTESRKKRMKAAIFQIADMVATIDSQSGDAIKDCFSKKQD